MKVSNIELHKTNNYYFSGMKYLKVIIMCFLLFSCTKEVEIEKTRKRYLINYRGFDFYVNVDTIIKPAMGHFLEVKSRTWSRQDAELKSKLISELISYLGASASDAVTKDYITMVEDK